MSYWTKRRKVLKHVDDLILGLSTDDSAIRDDGSLELPRLDCSVVCPGDSAVAHECAFVNVDESIAVCNQPVGSCDDPVASNPNDDFDDATTYYSDSDSSDECESEVDIVSQLRQWAVEHSITMIALHDLLAILRPRYNSLPKDPRTILRTANADEIEPLIERVSNGSYYHFGIANEINLQIDCNLAGMESASAISVQINIDGIPLFKSTNGQFWPVLGKIDSPFEGEPFVIGVFYGQCKPNNTDFLIRFVRECQQLTRTGIMHKNQKWDFFVSALICDAPARAFIKNIKGHNSYSGCERCIQTGVWEMKMTYPETNAPKRTDIAFDEMQDSDHHCGKSPISDIGIGMVSQVVLDYMHLICLGVVRRLIWLWLSGPVALKCRLRASCVTAISNSLATMRPYMPKEFARKPRSISEWHRWKATEFRDFLLYTGPVALEGKLPDALYKNFTVLAVGMYILLDKQRVSALVDYAEELLNLFVKHFAELYGSDMVVYNVHNVVHIADDARKYGALDFVSAFCFENFLGKLKKLVRKPSKPLQQLIYRILEKKQVHERPVRNAAVSSNLYKEHHSGYVPSNFGFCKQFQKLTVGEICISLSVGDNCITVGSDIVILRNILLNNCETFLVCQKFCEKKDFFSYPLQSSHLGIYLVSDLSNDMSVRRLSDFVAKNVLLPYKDTFVTIPMLNIH